MNDPSAGYNALYSSANVPAFGAPWDLDSFHDPQHQSTVYQHAEPGWQPTPMNATTPAQVSSFGVPASNYGLPYSGSSAAFDFPTFNQQTGQPFSTASYDTSLSYGNGPLLNSRNFETPSIADFGRGNTQNGTVSPQVLQSYPNAYGTGVGVSTGFQVLISVSGLCHSSRFRQLIYNHSLNNLPTMAAWLREVHLSAISLGTFTVAHLCKQKCQGSRPGRFLETFWSKI